MKKIVKKMKEGSMTAFDWRLVYGVFRNNFRKYDHYDNLKHRRLSVSFGAGILKRLERIKHIDEVTLTPKNKKARKSMFRTSSRMSIEYNTVGSSLHMNAILGEIAKEETLKKKKLEKDTA